VSSAAASQSLFGPATVATAAVSSGRLALVNVKQRALLVAKWRALWVLGLFGLVALTALIAHLPCLACSRTRPRPAR